jgi:hypothetical protein
MCVKFKNLDALLLAGKRLCAEIIDTECHPGNLVTQLQLQRASKRTGSSTDEPQFHKMREITDGRARLY